MIQKGAKIDTDFTLDVVQKGEERSIKFSELLDRPTVVSVYMRNNTSGCDNQNKNLVEDTEWFEEKGYNLMAISKDSCRSHKNYAENLNIDYVLASDPDYKFAEATNSIVEKKMFGKTFNAPSRSAFVIDADGTVLGIIEKINTNSHSDELKELINHL